MAYQDKLNYAERNSQKASVSNVITRMLEGFRDYLPLDTLLVLGEKAIKVEKSGRNSSPNLYLQHSKSLMEVERYQEAKDYLNTGLEQALNRTEWYGPIKDMYDLLTQIYIKEGNIEKAERSYSQYKIYQDSFVMDDRKDELEKITTNYELDKKKTEMEKEKSELEKKFAVFSNEKKIQVQQDFQKKAIAAEKYFRDSQIELAKKEKDLLEPVLKGLRETISKYGEKQGYTMIFEKTGSSVLFAKKGSDLTSKIVKAYGK